MSSRSLLYGFTLIELLFAMTLTVLLLMFGVPSFTTFVRNSEVRSAAESISNGLRAARSEATRRNVPVSFTLAGSSNPSWAINVFDPITSTLIQPPIQSFSKLEVGHSAKVTTTPGTAVAVTFNGLGRIVSPSPIATANIQQVDVSSIVAGEAMTLRIYADDVRGIRICNPSAAFKTANPTDARAC